MSVIASGEQKKMLARLQAWYESAAAALSTAVVLEERNEMGCSH